MVGVNEVYCPYCDELLVETDREVDDEEYWEIIADHCASHYECDIKRRENRRKRYGY